MQKYDFKKEKTVGATLMHYMSCKLSVILIKLFEMCSITQTFQLWNLLKSER
jgi:hypothetical protein